MAETLVAFASHIRKDATMARFFHGTPKDDPTGRLYDDEGRGKMTRFVIRGSCGIRAFGVSVTGARWFRGVCVCASVSPLARREAEERGAP